MHHADAFLRAIAAAPNDDAPRLIYADWLEERGDPRGAFIRVQCALERLDPADPARPALEDEARALQDQHEAEWTAPLRRFATAWRFRRGFVEEVELDPSMLSWHGDAFDSVPIHTIRFAQPRLPAAAVRDCALLRRARKLDLSGLRLGDADVETVLSSPHLTHLTALDLSGNALENRAVRTLAASPLMAQLTWLNLGGNYALGLTAARALAASPAPALRFLGLSRTNIGLVGLRDLLNSTSLSGLTALHAADIGRYGVAGVTPEQIARAPGLSRLTDLDLGGYAGLGAPLALLRSPALGRLASLGLRDCLIHDAGAATLAASPHLSGLTQLDLAHNDIGPVGCHALAASPHMAGLHTLHLGHNALRDQGVKSLAASPHLARLTHLDLSKNIIGGPGLQALAASPHLTGLTSLDLSENFVGDESLRALAGSPNLARLTSLRIRKWRLQPDAARALADSPRLARLAVLDLNDNELGDEGLRALLHSPHLVRLTELHVRSNGIGNAGADVLSALIGDSPRWPGLRKLDLAGNPLSGVEQRVLQQRFGARVEL